MIFKTSIYTENIKYFNRLAKNNSYILSSFPRSGNTWLRIMLSHLISMKHDQNYINELNVHQDQIIPDENRDKLKNCVEWAFKSVVIMKSHRTYLSLKKNISKKTKHIYLFRRPEDVLTSYYYFHLRYSHLDHVKEAGIDAFVLQKLDDYILHLESIICSGLDTTQLKVISYENLVQDTHNVMVSLTSWMDLSYSKYEIDKSIKLSSFKMLQEREKKISKKDVLFFRRGKIGEGEQELKTETKNILKNKTKKIINKMHEDYSYQSF